MKTAWKGLLVVGLVLTGGLAGPSRCAAASAPKTSLSIKIHVHDYAKLDPQALTEATTEASRIFQEAGIQSHWIDPDSADARAFSNSRIQLNILPSVMADRLGGRLPDNVVGVAPGNGQGRTLAYVFYNRVKSLTIKHAAHTRENTARVLGHVIAHEIGHLLLDIPSHSGTGIMRGDWDRADLRDAADGNLHFTPRQAEVLREEVGRRSGETTWNNSR